MLDNMFRGIFDSQSVNVISVLDFLLCLVVALGIGLLLAGVILIGTAIRKAFW